jgi:hypothetical protein
MCDSPTLTCILDTGMNVSRRWLGWWYAGLTYHLLPHMQDKCSLLQLHQAAVSREGASIACVRCRAHQGVRHLKSAPESNIKALKCTNCSGCQVCRQPVPLVIPEGTGGSGCSAEVAAKAAALHAALYGSSESASAGNGSAGKAAGGGADANPTLVECAVCHRKPGDPGVPATLKLCGACGTFRYCSAECQRKDWKMGHKEVCKHIVDTLHKHARKSDVPGETQV